MFKSLIKWIDCHKVIAFATVLEVLVGLGAIYVIYQQLDQSNQLKRFENYNYFNKVYSDWYNEMPKDINPEGKKLNWNDLKSEDKAWVRRYFDLYSEEYYFYKNRMIPNDMWDDLIHGKIGCEGAAVVNFKKYPVLLNGYFEWKKMGAFKHPKDFTKILENKLIECKLCPKDDCSYPL